MYQEKTMAFNPGHARRMRNALAGSGRVVQVGMQMNSGEGIQKVRELAASGGDGHGHAASRRTTFATGRTAAGSARSRRLRPRARRLGRVPGRGEACPVRPAALHQLAVLLGLLGRQRLREHGPHARLLVRGPRPVDPALRDHDRRQLPRRPRCRCRTRSRSR